MYNHYNYWVFWLCFAFIVLSIWVFLLCLCCFEYLSHLIFYLRVSCFNLFWLLDFDNTLKCKFLFKHLMSYTCFNLTKTHLIVQKADPKSLHIPPFLFLCVYIKTNVYLSVLLILIKEHLSSFSFLRSAIFMLKFVFPG